MNVACVSSMIAVETLPQIWAVLRGGTFVDADQDPRRLLARCGDSADLGRCMKRYVPASPVVGCVSFDMDGVLCLNEERTKRIHGIDRHTASWDDWSLVMSGVDRDLPGPFAVLAGLLSAMSVPVCVASTRPDSVLNESISWLNAHGISAQSILHRTRKEVHEPAAVVKLRMLEKLANEWGRVVHIDDDPAVALLQAEGVSVVYVMSDSPV